MLIGEKKKELPAVPHLMTAAAMAVAWAEEPPEDEETEADAVSLRRDLHAICDSCMLRSGAPRRAVAVYWWSEEIAHLREAFIRTRRQYTKFRPGWRGDETMVAYLYDAYREALRPLQRAIKEAMRRAWYGLLATLDSDPWGNPYRLVLNKLRPWALENMDP
jgi:hypothetical protein